MTPEPDKVHLHWAATVISILLSAVSWISLHIGPISGGFAILAAIFSIKASSASKRLSEDRLKNPHRYKWEGDE